MEKALEILQEIKTQKPFIYRLTHVWCRALAVNEPNKIEEAIAELEQAMKPKTCDGCVYGVFGVDSFGLEIECTLAYRCSRGQDDMFKPKEK